jgi:hypothetical protein
LSAVIACTSDAAGVRVKVTALEVDRPGAPPRREESWFNSVEDGLACLCATVQRWADEPP